MKGIIYGLLILLSLSFAVESLMLPLESGSSVDELNKLYNGLNKLNELSDKLETNNDLLREIVKNTRAIYFSTCEGWCFAI